MDCAMAVKFSRNIKLFFDLMRYTQVLIPNQTYTKILSIIIDFAMAQPATSDQSHKYSL